MKSFKFTNNLLNWRIDCFGLGASTNAKRGVKGLKIALIHPPFNHWTSLVGDEKQEKAPLRWSLLMYFLSRDSPWRAVVWLWHYKGQSHDVTYVLTACIPMRQSQETKRLWKSRRLIPGVWWLDFFICPKAVQKHDRKREDKKSFSWCVN